jgi:hypothetical protein
MCWPSGHPSPSPPAYPVQLTGTGPPGPDAAHCPAPRAARLPPLTGRRRIMIMAAACTGKPQGRVTSGMYRGRAGERV